MTRLLLLFLVLLFAGNAFTQPYYFRHYQVENGLSNNTINCSVQDKNGFMWFGTKDGLNRFDGYHFKVFHLDSNNERTLTRDLIYCLFVDHQGIVWAGSQKGLYKYDAAQERLICLIDSLPEVNSIQEDKEGQLWLLSSNTIYRYNFTSKSLKVFPAEDFFSATSICMVDGVLWAATADGFLQKLNPASSTFTAYNVFSHSRPTSFKRIQKIYPAGNHSLFVGTSAQGLKQFNTTTSTYKDLLTYNPNRTTIFVRDILQNSPSEFWFATESGIFILNTTTGKFINLRKKFLDPYSLSDNAIYTLYKDKEGGIWAGTYFGGINYYPKQYAPFQKYFPDYTKNSISGSVVREICEDPYHNLWIGTEDAGLNKLNLQTGAVTRFEPSGTGNSIAYSNIHGLLAVGNELWIGTFEHGLDIMDVRTGKIKKHFSAGPGQWDLKNNFIVSLLHTKAGAIFVGSGSSLYQYNQAHDGFDLVKELPEEMFVACLLEDHNHIVWLGTPTSGVFYFDPATKQTGNLRNNPDNKNSLTTNAINAICEDSNNNLWMATEGGGLCKLSSDRKQFTRYTVKNGLPGNFVFKIVEDNQKHLWVSTSKGLVNLDPANETITVFTKENGLLNDQFNYNSGYKDAGGKIYMGSVKGMIAFNPSVFSYSTFDPPTYITGFQVNNKELDINSDSSYLQKSIIYTRKITLPYNHSSFSIDFAALSFTSPEMTTYSYIMEGLDKEWTSIKNNRKVYFTNLSPGSYMFKVKATQPNSGSKNEKQLLIIIAPPLWATGRAFILYAVLLIGLLYYLVRSYHIIVEDKKEKEIYEAKIEFFTNVAHEIRTPLTLIKGPIENLIEQMDDIPQIKEDVTTMNRNTNRIINLITQILDFRQTETKGFSLDFTKVNITDLVRDTYENFRLLAIKRKLDYTIDLPSADIYAMADAEALNKIFSNLFSNAVKYASKEINIKLYPAEEKAFTVEISNDGPIIPAAMKERIFEPFFRLRETIKQKGTGIGLTLARSLAELHQGNLYLKDETAGLNTFILTLPLQRKQQKHSGKIKLTRRLKLK